MPRSSSPSDRAGAVDSEMRARIEAVVAGMEPAELMRVAGALLAGGWHDAVDGGISRRPLLRRPPRDDVVTFRVRIDLDGARPPIWRRLDLRSDMTLDVVHQVIQAAFGWWDYHLHRFALGGSVWDRDSEFFLCPYDVEEGEDEGTPASQVRLDETLVEPGDRLRYCYDYGDNWELTIKLESLRDRDSRAPGAVCVDGRRAAPPEDCGGWTSAEELAEVVDDPAAFDLEAVNEALRDSSASLRDGGLRADLVELVTRLRSEEYGDLLSTCANNVLAGHPPDVTADQRVAALQPFSWFLDRVGAAGLTLTAAGYLKPVDVKAAVGVLPGCADWIHSVRSESDAWPVLLFRESMQALGLVRKVKGRLVLTKAGAAARQDPERLWRQLVQRLLTGSERRMEHSAGLLALLMVAAGTEIDDALLAQAMSDLGWRMADGGPVTSSAVRRSLADLLGLMANLMTGPRRPLVTTEPPSEVARALARSFLLAQA